MVTSTMRNHSFPRAMASAGTGTSKLLLVFFCVWTGILGVEWFQYRAATEELTEAAGSRAMKIAQMVVLLLEADRDTYLSLEIDDPASRTDPDYLRLQERLRSAKAQFPDVRYLYTEKPFVQEGYLAYILDATPPDSADFSPIGERDPDVLDKLDRTDKPGYDSALHDYQRWGSLLTGWAPIFDANGAVHSYAAVDIDANQLAHELAAIRHSALIGAIVTSLLFLACGVAGIVLYRRRQQQLNVAAYDIEHYRHLALHDDLTALPNRALALERLDRMLGEATPQGKSVGVLYIDIDSFKSINDRYGHSCGDQVLIAATGRMNACVRDTDMVARLSGDEFLVLLSNIDSVETAVRIAEKIIGAHASPVKALGETIPVTASIGISCFPRHGASVDLLLHAADQALYAAKLAGRGCYRMAT
jgi:diguanylate cyclase (GGDEF)-like protein